LLCKDIEYIKSNIKVNLRDTGRGKINKSLLGMKTDKNSRKNPLPFKFLYFFLSKTGAGARWPVFLSKTGVGAGWPETVAGYMIT
jgi:hypothetical protein